MLMIITMYPCNLIMKNTINYIMQCNKRAIPPDIAPTSIVSAIHLQDPLTDSHRPDTS